MCDISRKFSQETRLISIRKSPLLKRPPLWGCHYVILPLLDGSHIKSVCKKCLLWILKRLVYQWYHTSHNQQSLSAVYLTCSGGGVTTGWSSHLSSVNATVNFDVSLRAPRYDTLSILTVTDRDMTFLVRPKPSTESHWAGNIVLWTCNFLGSQFQKGQEKNLPFCTVFI